MKNLLINVLISRLSPISYFILQTHLLTHNIKISQPHTISLLDIFHHNLSLPLSDCHSHWEYFFTDNPFQHIIRLKGVFTGIDLGRSRNSTEWGFISWEEMSSLIGDADSTDRPTTLISESIGGLLVRDTSWLWKVVCCWHLQLESEINPLTDF